jgi:WD40 repeat protein
MKRSVTVALGAVLLACSVSIRTAKAATEAEKVAAIQKGLAYLYNTQQPEGYWNSSGDEQAATGAAAFAFLSQEDKWGDNAAQYLLAVDKAMAHLVSTANIVNVGTRKDGINVCPGGAAACKGVYWFGNSKSTYATGLIAPAVAAYGLKIGAKVVATSSGPLAGMTWAEIAQGITNSFAASQSLGGNGNREGGWGSYILGNGNSDHASTHWAVTSLIYDETLGAVTPEVVKSELRVWLDAAPNAANGVCFQAENEQCSRAAAGSWWLAMKFVGSDLTESQVQAALNFLNVNWQSTANQLSKGNFGHPYAMLTAYKGLDATIGVADTAHISNLLTGCRAARRDNSEVSSGKASCTWSEDYSQWLITNQKADGSWGGDSTWNEPFATAFYVNILGTSRIPFLTNQLSKNSNIDRTQSTQQTSRLTTASATQVNAVGLDLNLPGPPDLDKLRPRIRKGVTGVAVNDDGSAIASASTDNTIRVFDPRTGRVSATLVGSVGLPTSLVFTKGGQITSVGRDSIVRLWDAVTGREIQELSGHEQAVNTVAASPDGTLLASAGEESRILLWDQTARKLKRIIFGPTNFVNDLAFSPDSRLLASAGEDARILIVDVAGGKTLYTLLGHSGPIDNVVFSPDGTVLASGGQDTIIHLWDPAKGQQLRVLQGHQAPIRTIAFSPDGQLMASAGEDTQIILWNTATGVINKILRGTTSAINSLTFDPKGRFLVSATEAGDITLWNVNLGMKLITIPVLNGL